MERLWSKIDQNGPDGCWLWTSTVTTEGYGQFWLNGRPRLAHRVVYEKVRGPIPRGQVIDHLCRVRNCVNPEHMEVVTQRENILRGTGPTAVNATKTECVNGHPFDAENTRTNPTGERVCKECQRDGTRRWRARKAVA